MKYIFLCFILLLIIFRYNQLKPDFNNGQTIKITQKVLTEPVRYDTSQGVKILGLNFYLPKYPEVFYGDTVTVQGLYDDGKIKDAKLVSLERNRGGLFSFRRKLVIFYQKSFPNPHSALVAGVTLGSKEGLGESFWEKLKETGTAHVVVASGTNVTLVASFLLSFFLSFMSRKRAVLASIFGIWGYSFLSGMDAPIVRAAIMGSLAFGAQGLGRINFAWRALFISIVAMLVIKPLWIEDLGFILSVVATASLMLFERKVNTLIRFVPSIFREGLSTSLAAQVGVAPILFVTFGQFNLLSPVINALILWTVPLMTVIGGMAGIAGLVWFDLGKLILYLIYPLTYWFIYIVNLFT